MDRFHQPMSWNQPTESGKVEPESNADDDSDGDPTGFSADDADDFAGCCQSGPLDDSPSHSQEFFVETSSWAHLTARRSFFLPLHYTPSYQYPLVVWLHCNGFNESQIDHVMPHISLRNYIGVGIRGTRAADSMGHRFDWHDSPAAIAATHDAVIEATDQALQRFSVHPARVVLAGYRHGGTMALRIAMRQPDRFAGAISLGGRMPQGAIRNVQQLRQRRLPMLWQWGQGNADYTEENLKRDCRSSMTIGGQVEVRQYPGDDEMDTVTLRDVDEWIMRRIVSGSSVTDSDRWATSPTLYSSN
jgi:phospholipase/carboxylesterase